MDTTPIEKLTNLQNKLLNQQQNNLQIFQKQILQELKIIRQTLITQSNKNQGNNTNDEKDKKIIELENENRRLNYRITVLTRNFRQTLNKQ